MANNQDKLTHLMKKAAPFIANVSGDVNEETVDQDIQAILMALETHKQGADHEKYDHVWEGNNRFLRSLLVNTIIPLMPETYDIGSSTYRFRKGFFSELSSLVFKKENVIVLDGQFLITKMAGSLPADVKAADVSIDFGRVMTVGDFVLFRSEGQMEYIEVSTLVSGTTYEVNRNLDGSGANDWPEGEPFAVLGSEGDGWLELSAVEERRFSVFVMGATFNSAVEIARYGEITGWQNAGFSGIGLAFGNFAAKKYFVSTDVDGMVAMGLSLKIGSGEKDVDLTGIQIDDTEIVGQADGVDQVVIGADGKLTAAGGDIRLDEDGITLESGDFWSIDNVNNIKWDYGTRPSIFGLGSSHDSLGGVIGNIAVNDDSETTADLTLISSSYNGLGRINFIASVGDMSPCQIFMTKSSDSNEISLQSDHVDITGNLIVDGTIKDGNGVEYGRPVFLTTLLTSTSWDGDARSTTAKTLIDLSAVFGVPAGVKAVSVIAAVRDSASATGEYYMCLSPVNIAYVGPKVACSGLANDKWGYGSFIVPCNSGGDIYYQLVASGTNTLDVYLQIQGYWL